MIREKRRGYNRVYGAIFQAVLTSRLMPVPIFARERDNDDNGDQRNRMISERKIAALFLFSEFRNAFVSGIEAFVS